MFLTTLFMSPLQRILLAVVVFAVIAAASSGYFYFQYQKSQKEIQSLKSDPTSSTKVAQEEARRLVEEVGKLIDLPANEEPTVATVTDITKLQNQSFFEKAKNGDKLLIYTSNKKAILYDPISKKIVDIAPVNIGSDSAQVAGASSSSNLDTVRVALRNGTSTVGLTTKYEADIKKSNPNVDVTSKENAEKKDYDRTIVVLLNDKAKDTSDKIAKELKASVESIPAGEKTPADADILVILGKS